MPSIFRSLVVMVLGSVVFVLYSADGRPSIATVGNQSAYVYGGGTFLVRGIPAFAAWQRNEDGTISPGPPILYQARVMRAQGGIGVSAERFEIPFVFDGDPPVVDVSPILIRTDQGDTHVRLSATVPVTELAYGQKAQMAITATAGNGSTVDLTTDPATLYTSSNPLVATVSSAGVITARKR